MKKISLLTLLVATQMASAAFASGFQLAEYSAVGLGRAMAGKGVVGDDYSAVATNPAGMTLKETGAQVGTTAIFLRAEVEGTNNGTPGKEGDINLRQWVPHVFGQYKLNDKTRLGLGIYAPFGLSTIYSRDWFGSSHAMRSKFMAVDFNMSASYDVTDKLTVGGSAIMQLAKANLTNKLPTILGANAESEVDADSWSPAYKLGMVYKFTDYSRVGFSYHSKITHKLKGEQTITGRTLPVIPGMTPSYLQNGVYSGRAKITLPEYLEISGYHRIKDFGLSATARWTRWSRFNSLDIYSSNLENGVHKTPEKWRNVWMLSLGLDYYLNDTWTVRLGTAYDQSPVSSAKYRTARIPDGNRIWTSVGLSYRYKQVQLDLGYSHMFIKAGKTHYVSSGSELNAKYTSHSNLVGAQLQYDF